MSFASKLLLGASALPLACALAVLPATASAKGCIKGAAVGGVGGHVLGGHGVAGAAVGCVVGRHNANKKDAQAAAAQRDSAPPAGQAAQPAPAR
jgi:hypothetical protein